MRITICDRCKAQIKHPNIDGIGTIRIEVKGERGTVMKENPWKDWDLCPSCVADIKQYVEAPIREAEAEEAEKPKATIKNRKVKTVTIEQVKELADSGMKPKDIAEKLGCNVQTIYNRMHDMKLNEAEVPNEETEPDTEGDAQD